MMGVMGIAGVFGMIQISNTDTFVKKAQIDLDIKITDLKVKRLLSNIATCGNGLQDSSGSNLLVNIGTTDLDVTQIIKHTESSGVSTALAPNDRRHLRLPMENFKLLL